jgi:hypothetical protein
MVCCADHAGSGHIFLEHVAGTGFEMCPQQACLLAHLLKVAMCFMDVECIVPACWIADYAFQSRQS